MQVFSVLDNLQDNKILAMSKLRAFADNKLNINPSINLSFMG